MSFQITIISFKNQSYENIANFISNGMIGVEFYGRGVSEWEVSRSIIVHMN